MRRRTRAGGSQRVHDCILRRLQEQPWIVTAFSGLHEGAAMVATWAQLCPCSVSTLTTACVFVPSFSAVCEMCGIVGTREAFFSKTKRFCSVSCSRSYSSNSKKASILARLQVSQNPSFFTRDGVECACTQGWVVAL